MLTHRDAFPTTGLGLAEEPCLLTTKRSYRRLMEEEVRIYAETEAEVAAEIRELFLVLG